MKTFRYATPELNIDIKMPDILFWFFKKFAKFSSSPVDSLNGASLDLIIFDPAPSR